MCGRKPTLKKSTTLLGLALAATGFAAGPASAQTMEGILEEIVVTAQKRE